MYDLKPQARPYAKAAFLASVEKGLINEMFDDLKVLSEACSDSNINKLIESPEEKS
jgi:F0F1-type ATP synthase delta subunit